HGEEPAKANSSLHRFAPASDRSRAGGFRNSRITQRARPEPRAPPPGRHLRALENGGAAISGHSGSERLHSTPHQPAVFARRRNISPSAFAERARAGALRRRARSNRSRGKAFAAGTVRDGVRVGYFETALLQIIAVIDRRTADKKCALRIHHHADV